MMEKGVAVSKHIDNKRYIDFMRDILLGEYTKLTGPDSKYVKSKFELNSVIKYASEVSSPLFQDYPVDDEIPKVQFDQSRLILPQKLYQPNTLLVSYDRSTAIDYAYLWWDSRNGSYPDFGGNDCTNFIVVIGNALPVGV